MQYDLLSRQALCLPGLFFARETWFGGNAEASESNRLAIEQAWLSSYDSLKNC